MLSLYVRRGLLLSACALPLTAAAQGRVSGTVYDSLRTRGPLADALVTVEGAPEPARTDRRGRFTLSAVPAGARSFTFFHPSLDSMGLAAPVLRVEVPESGLRAVELAVPSLATMGRAMCGAPLDTASAIVIGRVREVETGEPLSGAAAAVEWHEMTFAEGAGLSRRNRRAAAVSTATGDFLLCGVPADIVVPLVVRAGGASTGIVELALNGAPVATREVAVSLRDPAARVEATDGLAATLPEVPGLARLRAVVTDGRGRTVADAVVGIRGSPVSARSDSLGRVLLLGAPSGTQTVVARAIGRAPTSIVQTLLPEQVVSVGLELDSATVRLPDYVVRGVRPDPVREAFERRRRSGTGYFLDREALDRRGAGIRSLRGVPGLFLDFRGASFYPALRMRSGAGDRCAPSIMLDGMPLMRVSSWEIDALLRDAARVEVYPRPLAAPTELMVGRDCGAIGIWTR